MVRRESLKLEELIELCESIGHWERKPTLRRIDEVEKKYTAQIDDIELVIGYIKRESYPINIYAHRMTDKEYTAVAVRKDEQLARFEYVAWFEYVIHLDHSEGVIWPNKDVYGDIRVKELFEDVRSKNRNRLPDTTKKAAGLGFIVVGFGLGHYAPDYEMVGNVMCAVGGGMIAWNVRDTISYIFDEKCKVN